MFMITHKDLVNRFNLIQDLISPNWREVEKNRKEVLDKWKKENKARKKEPRYKYFENIL